MFVTGVGGICVWGGRSEVKIQQEMFRDSHVPQNWKYLSRTPLAPPPLALQAFPIPVQPLILR